MLTFARFSSGLQLVSSSIDRHFVGVIPIPRSFATLHRLETRFYDAYKRWRESRDPSRRRATELARRYSQVVSRASKTPAAFGGSSLSPLVHCSSPARSADGSTGKICRHNLQLLAQLKKTIRNCVHQNHATHTVQQCLSFCRVRRRHSFSVCYVAFNFTSFFFQSLHRRFLCNIYCRKCGNRW